MLQLQTSHILTGEELSVSEITQLLELASYFKQNRRKNPYQSALAGQSLALLFEKPSLRTRFSFTVAMRELGGDVVESLGETRKHEEPADQARVLAGYCHGIMIRTHEDSILEQMRAASAIPIINGLSKLHHPCQIFADLQTLQETFGKLAGLRLTYLGDGNNVLHSLLLLAPVMGITVHYACPADCLPDAAIVARAKQRAQQYGGAIQAFDSPQQAVAGAQAVYTDVWTSMGCTSKTTKTELFAGYQVNEKLMQLAAQDAIFMHCLPMERGKEVSLTLPDAPCSVIFKQSENRLHVQKALLIGLLNSQG
jgi:ornithine carbamoyltransferase